MKPRKPLRRSPLVRRPASARRVALEKAAKKLRRTLKDGKGTRKGDRNYLRWLTTQPCAVCGAMGTDPAHVGERGMGEKCPDREAIPLCPRHHRRQFPQSHHSLGKGFWLFHELDKAEQIKKYNDLYDSPSRGETFAFAAGSP